MRPLVLRLQATVPLPVPDPVVSVVHAFRLAALQLVALALLPVIVTAAVAPAAVPPCATVILRDAGLTASVNDAVIVSVSIVLAGEPDAPVAATEIVST